MKYLVGFNFNIARANVKSARPFFHAQRILLKMGTSRIAKSKVNDFFLEPLEGLNFG